MKRKGHLCLIGGTQSAYGGVQTSMPTEERVLKIANNDLSSAKTVARHSPQERMKDAENELLTMKEVTDAAFMLMRALPMEQLESNELMELYDLFMSGVDVLDLYVAEFNQLSMMRLAPHEMKQLSRLRKLHWHLSEIVPDAAELVSETVKKLKAEKIKTTASKSTGRKKTATLKVAETAKQSKSKKQSKQ